MVAQAFGQIILQLDQGRTLYCNIHLSQAKSLSVQRPTEYYAVVKTNPGLLGEQFRLGFGLERDMPRWSFGLMAEYSRKSQIASTGMGVLFLRGGISYKL